MRFRFIEGHRNAFATERRQGGRAAGRMCKVMGLSAHVDCGLAALAQPVAGSAPTLSSWRISKNNYVSAWAAMVVPE